MIKVSLNLGCAQILLFWKKHHDTLQQQFQADVLLSGYDIADRFLLNQLKLFNLNKAIDMPHFSSWFNL